MSSSMMPPPPPPPGGDQNLALRINAVAWTGVVLSIVLVAGRLYARLRLTRSPGWDDLLIVIALVLDIVASALSTAGTYSGLGRHVYYLQPEQITRAVYLSIISQPITLIGFCLPKMAIAILIVRLMGTVRRGIWFLYFITISLTILSTLCGIFLFVQCSPPYALWHPELAATAQCWPPSVLANFTTFSSAYSAFVDLSLALFPISVFWDLKISLKNKIAICALMGLGVFATICAIIKTTYLSSNASKTDYTFDTVNLICWSLIEFSVIIICACIPTLRPIVQLIRGRETKSSHARARYDDKGYKASNSRHYASLSPDRSTLRDPISTSTRRQDDDLNGYGMNIKRTVDIEMEHGIMR